MKDELELFLEELKAHSLRLRKTEFEFIVENWGLLWTPWFIYMEGERLEFSISALEYTDLNRLVALGCMAVVKEYTYEELKDLELSKTLFKLLK